MPSLSYVGGEDSLQRVVAHMSESGREEVAVFDQVTRT